MTDIFQFLSSSSVLLIAAFTPIILAIVALAKNWIANDRWYPIISVAVGVLLSVFFSGLVQVSYQVLLGVLAGLSASGLYSGSKTVAGKE